MTALHLHHSVFANEKDSDLPLRSAASFLHPVPERDGTPTGKLLSSAAYQDLIQRQPTHPDGPMSGWDLGLNLLGDPITAAERKSFEDHQTKMKLRRLRVINIGFELLFGIWGTYTIIRYSLALADGLGDSRYISVLVLDTMSALAVALVIISILMPLFPQQNHPRAWRYARSLVRACYLFLLSASAAMNCVLVLIWHPSQLCNWDIDISWYTSAANTASSACHTALFATWIAAAVLRLVVTLTMVFLFIYALRSYHGTRHPIFEENGPKYSPYLSSDPEDISPISASSPHHFSKSTFQFTLSEDSNHTLSQSNTTLPKSNSISTLAPSTFCTGHSRSYSSPTLKDVSLPRISPPTSRRTSTHAASHGSSTQTGPEMPSQTQSDNAITTSSWVPHMLRRTSRISVTQVTSDTMLPDITSHPERLHSPTIIRDPSEIRSCASWRPGHHGSGAYFDFRKSSLAWENGHVPSASQVNVVPESFSSTHDGGESIKEKGKGDDVLVYSYGYGVSGPTYPYLDMYNPQRPCGRAKTSSLSEYVDEHGPPQGHRRSIPGGPALPDVSSEPRSLPSTEEDSSGEEEEYVAMMGGFVRRMATIESLGSKEAAGTPSTTGSVALHSMRSGMPASQLSSVRFADLGSSWTSSLGVSSSRRGSLSTTYFSFSSGGTGMRVNERGELLPGIHADTSAAGSPYDHHDYTASGSSSSSFPRDE